MIMSDLSILLNCTRLALIFKACVGSLRPSFLLNGIFLPCQLVFCVSLVAFLVPCISFCFSPLLTYWLCCVNLTVVIDDIHIFKNGCLLLLSINILYIVKTLLTFLSFLCLNQKTVTLNSCSSRAAVVVYHH